MKCQSGNVYHSVQLTFASLNEIDHHLLSVLINLLKGKLVMLFLQIMVVRNDYLCIMCV